MGRKGTGVAVLVMVIWVSRVGVPGVVNVPGSGGCSVGPTVGLTVRLFALVFLWTLQVESKSREEAEQTRA